MFSFLKSASSNLSKYKVSCKKKKFKFVTENTFFNYFWAAALRTVFMFEIMFENTSIFSKMQSFMQNKKKIKLRPKMSYLGIFSWDLLKLLSYFTLAFYDFPFKKFRVKTKTLTPNFFNWAFLA